jgi:uncharacterized protein with HEPN domain
VLKRGIERGIEIVSEASRRIPDALKADHPGVPWKDVAAIGNVLRHEYNRVSDRAIWNAATQHLAALRRAIISIRQSPEP